MKRVKIMLISLTLLAIVGGALAFKAKFTLEDMCTTSTTFYNGVNLTSCPIQHSWVLNMHGTTIFYTTTLEDGDCLVDFGGGIKPVACYNSKTLTSQE